MTTGTWVLIIAMYSPGGDFMSKRHEFVESRRMCEAQRQEINQREPNPLGVKERAVCVTYQHWTGARPMKSVALD